MSTIYRAEPWTGTECVSASGSIFHVDQTPKMIGIPPEIEQAAGRAASAEEEAAILADPAVPAELFRDRRGRGIIDRARGSYAVYSGDRNEHGMPTPCSVHIDLACALEHVCDLVDGAAAVTTVVVLD